MNRLCWPNILLLGALCSSFSIATTGRIFASNPVPSITLLSPAGAYAGGISFQLNVQGTNFASDSQVRWKGSGRPTTFIDSTLLIAEISANDLSQAGPVSVTVFNPAPGGGTSNALIFNVTNVIPTISSLNPNSNLAGAGSFALTVNGSRFVTTSQVLWNGSPRPTVFINLNQLKAVIPASDIASAASATVKVSNYPSGLYLSGPLEFLITSTNPLPIINSLDPNSIPHGSTGPILTVSGSNFVYDSKVRWKGSNRQTSFISSTQLEALLSDADVATAGLADVTVFNAAPGGGDSISKSFAITQENPVPVIRFNGLFPNFSPVGGDSFTLLICGSNFTHDSKVQWNGSDRATTFVRTTQLEIEVPDSDLITQGSASVVVLNPSPGGGSSANETRLFITNNFPDINKLNPGSLFELNDDFTLTVDGNHFDVASRIHLNGQESPTRFVDKTHLETTIPAVYVAAGKPIQIGVYNPGLGGGISNILALAGNNPSLSISSISPQSGPITGGVSVLINGTGFQSGTKVEIGNVGATVISISPIQITAVINSATSTGVFDVVLTDPGGTKVTLKNGFTYTSNVSPVLISLTPSTRSQGSESFILTASGDNFTERAIVQWNGLPRVTQFFGSNQVKAAISTNDILNQGTAHVTVSMDGIVTSPVSFAITPNNSPADLTGVLPKSGSVLGNTKVSILGRNFTLEMANSISNPVIAGSGGEGASEQTSGNTQILFGEKKASNILFVNSSKLKAVTPSNSEGISDVSLIHSDGTQAILPQAYTFQLFPQLPPPDPGAGGLPKRLRIPLVIDSAEFRTNLGINNLGSIPAVVRIFLLNNHGEVMATQPAMVPPHGLTQILNVVRYLEGVSTLTGREGSLVLESAQSIAAWASLIDNLTGDPSLQIARTESEAASFVMIPTSAAIGRFSTSLIVVNNSFAAGQVTIRSRQASGGIQASLSNLQIDPNGYLYFEDFYSEAGLGGVFGPIEIEAVGAIKVLAAARIYTREGTSGFMDGVNGSLASKKIVLPYSLDTDDFRTNLGITNPGSDLVNVTVSLLDRDGLTLGTLATTVPSHGLTQINNVNQVLLNSGTISNQEGYLELKADHPIFGWTSQIDNVFSDLSLVVGKSPIGATKVLIPSTVDTSNFRSSLAIVNLDSLSTNVQITARDNDGNVRQLSNLTIPGNGFFFYGNILSSLGLEGTFGPLEISSLDSKPLLAVSRVYSPQRTGGYFEGIDISP